MRRTVCSWSGGKDSALALHLAVESGAECIALFSMLDESGLRSRSHGLPLAVLDAQSAALGLPLVTRAAAWHDYTDAFVDGLEELAAVGCTECVFGDIDTEAHRRWCEGVCARAGLATLHPLWQRERRELAAAVFERGIAATLVVVREPPLDASFLERRFDEDLVRELEARGVDACGENGEFHTVVTDGPLFAEPLELGHLERFQVGDCHCLAVRADVTLPA